MLDQATEDSALGAHLRRHCIFNIVPILNVDGVFQGQTRWDAQGLDLERRWYRLDIIKRTAGGPLDTRGTVTFDAFWRSGDDRGAQREVSNFARENGRWFYVAALDLGAATPASPVN
jgi:uncharacterized protein YchJ